MGRTMGGPTQLGTRQAVLAMPSMAHQLHKRGVRLGWDFLAHGLGLAWPIRFWASMTYGPGMARPTCQSVPFEMGHAKAGHV